MLVRPVRNLLPERIPVGADRVLVTGELIGKGSAGSVFRAMFWSREGVAFPVALKMFGGASSEDVERLVSSVRELARRVACVRHPNVVEVLDVGVYGVHPFLVLELVDGSSLDALLGALAPRRQRLPLDIAIFIAVEVAEGLSGARVARDPSGATLALAHLGLTAREVLLSRRGEVKIGDFGASAARAASSGVRNMTSFARRVGTMAPEIARGEYGDERSDVFSLGLLLREMLVGPRFAAATAGAEALRLAREGYVRPDPFEPTLQGDLGSVMRRALQIDPQDRYPNATAMLFDLRRAALGLGVGDARFFLRNLVARLFFEGRDETTTHTFGFLPEGSAND